jgi:hypothetical protein
LARVPEPLRADCATTTSLPDDAEAGWSCFTTDGRLAYVYVAFATGTVRHAYFDRIVTAMGAYPPRTAPPPTLASDRSCGDARRPAACSDVDGSPRRTGRRRLHRPRRGAAIDDSDLRAFFKRPVAVAAVTTSRGGVTHQRSCYPDRIL